MLIPVVNSNGYSSDHSIGYPPSRVRRGHSPQHDRAACWAMWAVDPLPDASMLENTYCMPFACATSDRPGRVNAVCVGVRA